MQPHIGKPGSADRPRPAGDRPRRCRCHARQGRPDRPIAARSGLQKRVDGPIERSHGSLSRKEPRMKHVEYVLLTACLGASVAAFGSVVWPALAHLASVFTHIAQALQGLP
jgi:hypothetical protein